MTSSQLRNYLCANRKRLALSQGEVAFLLGNRSGTKVSRYERFERNPGLETALALEVIFQKPARELFGGIYQKVEKEVASRAKALRERESKGQSNSSTNRKLEILMNIAERQLN